MASADKKMQKHILETVERFGRLDGINPNAIEALESAGYTMTECVSCCKALIHDGYLIPVTFRPDIVQAHSGIRGGQSDRYPECLTIKGKDYLYELQHPVRTWLKRNWFVATVAGATIVASLAGPAAALAIALWIAPPGPG